MKDTIIATDRKNFVSDEMILVAAGDVAKTSEIVVYVVQKDATANDLGDSTKAWKAKTIKIKQ